MSNVPPPFKVNVLNLFCGFTLMVLYGTLLGNVGFFLAFFISMMCFPPFEERK